MPGTNSSSGMKAGMSFSSGCPHADSSEALVAPTLVRIMNSRLFIEDPKPQMNTDEHRSNSDCLNQCSLCCHRAVPLLPICVHLCPSVVFCFTDGKRSNRYSRFLRGDNRCTNPLFDLLRGAPGASLRSCRDTSCIRAPP